MPTHRDLRGMLGGRRDLSGQAGSGVRPRCWQVSDEDGTQGSRQGPRATASSQGVTTAIIPGSFLQHAFPRRVLDRSPHRSNKVAGRQNA
jgi:hypothetical protein